MQGSGLWGSSRGILSIWTTIVHATPIRLSTISGNSGFVAGDAVVWA
jgi:hypothetical protein